MIDESIIELNRIVWLLLGMSPGSGRRVGFKGEKGGLVEEVEVEVEAVEVEVEEVEVEVEEVEVEEVEVEDGRSWVRLKTRWKLVEVR